MTTCPESHFLKEASPWLHAACISFRSIGFKAAVPKGYKKIPIFFVYAVKETGRYKSRLVAGGHVLPPTLDVVYSGVVSLRAVRLICFVAELNDLKLMSSDISNASTKVCSDNWMEDQI